MHTKLSVHLSGCAGKCCSRRKACLNPRWHAVGVLREPPFHLRGSRRLSSFLCLVWDWWLFLPLRHRLLSLSYRLLGSWPFRLGCNLVGGRVRHWLCCFLHRRVQPVCRQPVLWLDLSGRPLLPGRRFPPLLPCRYCLSRFSGYQRIEVVPMLRFPMLPFAWRQQIRGCRATAVDSPTGSRPRQMRLPLRNGHTSSRQVRSASASAAGVLSLPKGLRVRQPRGLSVSIV